MKNIPLKPLILLSVFAIFALSCSDDDRNQEPEHTVNNFADFDLQGHRGARGLLPENTIPSLLEALKYHVNTLEFDVVVTRDSLILVSHEPWFHHDISTHPDGRPVRAQEFVGTNIFRMTYEETQQFDVGQRGHERFPEQQPMAVTKPLMKDAVRAVDEYSLENGLPLVDFSIELKSSPEWYNEFVPESEKFVKLAHSEIMELGIRDRTILQSFDVNILKEMRKLDEEIRIAYLINNENSFEENMDLLGFTPEIYSPNFRLVDENLVKKAHDAGMLIIPWTINEIEDMEKIIATGVDGLITDYPNRAAEILGRK